MRCDGNGVYDKGESADVTVTYRSFSLGATENFTVRLSSGDPDLSVTSAITADWTVPADTTFSISGELSFAVAEDAEGHMAELVLEGAVDGTVVTQDTLSILIGKTPVLLVADDWEDCCGDVRVDGFYEGILKENAVSYGVWDHSKHGSPSAETLKSFPIVIWFTEWDFPSLDSLDRAALRAYMDGGGNLYLSGQDLGWDLNENLQRLPACRLGRRRLGVTQSGRSSRRSHQPRSQLHAPSARTAERFSISRLVHAEKWRCANIPLQ